MVFPVLRSQEPRLVILGALAFGLAFASVGCVAPPCVCSQPAVSAAPPPSAAPAPPTARATPPGWQTYRVQPGDTLVRIAACHGATVDDIVRENAIYDRDRIVVGWSLRVPGQDLCDGEAPAIAAVQRARAATPASPQAANERAADPAKTARGEEATSNAVAGRDPRAQQLLDTARADYDAALFDAALRGAEAAAAALARSPRSAGTDAQRARAHLLAGMAAAGLEERERALTEFEHAFALDPDAELAPEDRSPRLLELFQLARGRRAERTP
ncbi:MAG TPA: LysM peptidoglycan-binding domain-containing protein [Myxococcota bacterium]|nr:LysM peptidoglycan-binding domain-containing protein [Myxococcota bacterium]